MRLARADRSDKRANALWGRGSRGETRSNALWGRGGRRSGAAVAVLAVGSLRARSSTATAGRPRRPRFWAFTTSTGSADERLRPGLAGRPIQKNPTAEVRRHRRGLQSSDRRQRVDEQPAGRRVQGRDRTRSAARRSGARSERSTACTPCSTGAQIAYLAKTSYVSAIVPNDKVAAELRAAAVLERPEVAVGRRGGGRLELPGDRADGRRRSRSSTPGSTRSRADFGSRVLDQVDLTSLTPNSPGDGYGHGTFVAGIAAGGAGGFAGVAPSANLVLLDVMNDQGEATVADIVAACDWILQNKDAVQHPRRQLLAARDGPREPLLRPARPGRGEAVAQRRRRGHRRRQLRRERSAERRSVRSGQRPVRDHRRRVGHQRHGQHERRHRRSVVGLGLHARRLHEA